MVDRVRLGEVPMLTWFSQHGPKPNFGARDYAFLHHFKSVMLVDRYTLLSVSFKIAGQILLIHSRKHGSQQFASVALTLKDRVNTDREQIPMGKMCVAIVHLFRIIQVRHYP